MAQQTWIITFNDTSLSEANQYASQLKKALQGTSLNITVEQQSSVPYTQNLGDMIITTIKDHSTIAAVASVIAVFIQSRRIGIKIKVKDTEMQAKNIDSKNFKETLELLIKQAEEHGSGEE